MSTAHPTKHRIPGGLAAAVLALLLAGPAAAQQAGASAGWTAWLGCWEAVEDAPDAASTLCVRPTGADREVELLTVEGEEVVDRRVVRADGERRETAREGCAGWERAEFSRDGRRVHIRSELECEGVERESSGMIAFVSSTEWVDVRAVGVEGRRSAWVRRYRATERPAGIDLAPLDDRRLSVETARMAAGSPPDLDAVTEAAERVHPEAVTAWIVELDRRFRLDGERLLRLADAGVPEDVIDVVVAVSHPERFSVGGAGDVAERQVAGRSQRESRYRYRSGAWYGNPFRYRPYRFRHPYRFGWTYGWGYGFTPWSYGRFGWNHGGAGFGYRPVVIRVQERVEQPEGRVVNGRGYTRTGRSGSSESSGSASPSSGRTGISGSRPSTRTRVSPSGGYTGSSSSGSGRKAKPRGGSGGSGGSGDGGGSGGGR